MKLRFSIITPSLNQAQFIPHCLKSVKNQCYKWVEHVVYDPGSTDGSREIVRNEDGVQLVDEPDEGQCDAINKGFASTNGDLLAWLNSDDYYFEDDVLSSVAERFLADDSPDVVYGKAIFVNENGEFLRDAFVNDKPDTLRSTLVHQVGIIQPAVFIRRSAYERIGGLDLDFEYALDYEYWARAVTRCLKWAYLDKVLAAHRWWPQMKTASNRSKSLEEHCKVGLKHFGYAHWRWVHRLADCVVGGVDGIIKQNTDKVDKLERSRKIATYYNKFNVDHLTGHDLLSRGRTDNNVRETLSDMANHSVGFREGTYSSWQIVPKEGSTPMTWEWHADRNKEGRDLVAFVYTRKQSFAMWKSLFIEETKRASDFIEAFKQDREHDTCIVVGNGPSLNRTPIREFDNCDVIISNFAYYKEELLLKAKFLTIVNDLVMRQAAFDLPQLRSINKIFPIWLSKYSIDTPNTYFLNANLRPEFSKNIYDWISWRSTVSFFNLQLAAGLGYSKILLVGFDHSYTQPKSVKEGDLIDQKSEDVNHFLPEYFRGKEWHAADVGNMNKVYEISKEAASEMGVEIVNCTAGGNLDVFRRGKIAEEKT